MQDFINDVASIVVAILIYALYTLLLITPLILIYLVVANPTGVYY